MIEKSQIWLLVKKTWDEKPSLVNKELHTKFVTNIFKLIERDI